MLLSSDPISIPTDATAVMYGCSYNPVTDLLSLSHRQYRADSGGLNCVPVGAAIYNGVQGISTTADADAAALWAAIQPLAAQFAIAKGFSGTIGFSLSPLIRNSAVTGKMIFWVSGIASYVSGDVFADAQSDGDLAALVVPFQSAIAAYAAAEGW